MISDSGEIIPGASDLGNLSPLQSQGSLFNPLGLDPVSYTHLTLPTICSV